jgi:hypothetical protein
METNTPPVTYTRRSRRREWITAGAVVGLVAIVGTTGAAVSAATADHSTAIEKASKACGAETNVDDNGHSISFDTKGEDDATGDNVFAVVCVTNELAMSDSIVQRIDHTRALDGTQSADWDGYTATWSYHPDSGMFLLVEVPS